MARLPAAMPINTPLDTETFLRMTPPRRFELHDATSATAARISSSSESHCSVGARFYSAQVHFEDTRIPWRLGHLPEASIDHLLPWLPAKNVCVHVLLVRKAVSQILDRGGGFSTWRVGRADGRDKGYVLMEDRRRHRDRSVRAGAQRLHGRSSAAKERRGVLHGTRLVL
ncbi:hypothetical protein HPB50_014430 [Hyalomma asiaticum]|uniref:Uncharacterized protein n=1 Tax=Hyalomma asiaticum TaxID=266040 RepID=A0ACB7TA87_HYAAI|nr:hypothetical protein HPB50_014430 [Hyalomma asiaticum]